MKFYTDKKFSTLMFLLVVLIVAVLVIPPLLVKVLWNWVIVSIFGLRAISFWEAFGLYILSSLLFRPIGYEGNKGDK